MKTIFLLLVIAFLAACTAPIKTQQVSEHISKDASLEKSDITKILPVDYTVTSNTSIEGIWKRGILAMTDNELLIYTTDHESSQSERELRLTFDHLRGIDKLKRGHSIQIQLLVDVGILAIEFPKPDSMLLDKKVSWETYYYLKSKGVAAFSAKGLILFPTGGTFIMPIPGP